MTDRLTNIPTNQPTDRLTDQPSNGRTERVIGKMRKYVNGEPREMLPHHKMRLHQDPSLENKQRKIQITNEI